MTVWDDCTDMLIMFQLLRHQHCSAVFRLDYPPLRWPGAGSRVIKTEFHYADFPVPSATNLWRSRWFVRDVADFPVSCRGRRRFSRFPDANWLVADLSREFFKPPRHVAMVWNPETSPWRRSGVMEFGLYSAAEAVVMDTTATACKRFLVRNIAIVSRTNVLNTRLLS